MFVTVTVKAEAESQEELEGKDFGPQLTTLRDHFEMLKKEGVFGPPEQIALRYLFIGETWRAPKQAVQQAAVPDVT